MDLEKVLQIKSMDELLALTSELRYSLMPLNPRP
jgi:hypothetical protein